MDSAADGIHFYHGPERIRLSIARVKGSMGSWVVTLKNPQPINTNVFEALWANAILDTVPVEELVAVN